MVIVVVNDILRCLVAKFIGLSENTATLKTPSSNPHAESIGVVIPADVGLVLNDR